MKFYLHRLGCPKNDVDADYLAARLISDGHQAVNSPDDAEAVIVNTCGFILPAKQESIDEILKLARLKVESGLRRLYACGCLSQRYGDELIKEIPELDAVFGVGSLEALAQDMAADSGTRRIHRTEPAAMRYIDWGRRFISDRMPYAYVKISDGCDRTCSFCSIPGIRGPYRSRPLDSILKEAEYLAAKGKKELILVSQESSLYGHDLRQGYDIVRLLKELDTISGVQWIRLMYLYPTQVGEALVDHLIDPGNKSLEYFDLPLQHINDDILQAMARRTGREQIERLIKMIRSKNAQAVLRTAFIVGFPGETEEQYQELREFVVEMGFDRLGVFSFSPEEDTAAAALSDQVPAEVKEGRLEDLMLVQQEVAFARNNSLIGNIVEVIIDSPGDDGRAVGRTRADCPEIDQEILVTGESLEVGSIIPVRVEAVDGYDLIGSRVSG